MNNDRLPTQFERKWLMRNKESTLPGLTFQQVTLVTFTPSRSTQGTERPVIGGLKNSGLKNSIIFLYLKTLDPFWIYANLFRVKISDTLFH